MLAKESKSSSLVKSATRFLRHELRKIFIRHKKKKWRRRYLSHRRCILRVQKSCSMCTLVEPCFFSYSSLMVSIWQQELSSMLQ